MLVPGASVEGGTGWVTAQRLASMGGHVTVGARRLERAAILADEIGGTAVACDATMENQVEAIVAEAVRVGQGDLDVAVLAAGEGVSGTIDGIGDAEFERCMALNYTAAVYFVRHVTRRMKPGGGIVLMSSIAATNPWPGYFAYGCAKAALQTLVKYAALEYAERPIRINAVCPGPVATVPGAPEMPQAVSDVIDGAMPLRRRVTPAEVADAVAWLACGATATTGDMVHLDGGMHLGRPSYPAEIKAALQGV
ncbi:MAG: SDR family oxidoreductase [Sphingomonadaceae bacterium]